MMPAGLERGALNAAGGFPNIPDYVVLEIPMPKFQLWLALIAVLIPPTIIAGIVHGRKSRKVCCLCRQPMLDQEEIRISALLPSFPTLLICYRHSRHAGAIALFYYGILYGWPMLCASLLFIIFIR